MGLQTAPGYIGVGGFTHPVELDRNFLEGLFPRSGALAPGDFTLTPTVGSLAMNIGAGRAAILGTESSSTTQGAYFAWSNAAEDLAWASPSGSPRIDALVLQIYDSQYGTITGLPRAAWRIIQGTPGGSPVAPADSVLNSGGASYEPGAWWRVANVRIDPSDTVINPANITRFQISQKPQDLVGTAAQRAASTGISSGDRWFETDTGRTWRWNGTLWMPPPGTLVGKIVRNSAQSIANNTLTALSWNAQEYMPFGGWAISPNPTRFVPPFPGWYNLEFFVGWAASPATQAIIARKNGTDITGAKNQNSATGLPGIRGTGAEYFNGTTDYIEVIVLHVNGAAMNTYTAAGQPDLIMTLAS